MDRHPAISIGDVAAAGLRLRPTEAVTIVRAIALQVAGGELPGVPSPHVIRLSAAGLITVEGPVAAGGGQVVRAAQLLSALLTSRGAGQAEAAALRAVIARTMSGGAEEGGPLGTLTELADALAPFAAQDPVAVVRDLAARWAVAATGRLATESGSFRELRMAAPERPPRASSETDVGVMRRARRATGLSLQDVSVKSRIPVAMLRQLEWGYLRNWPTGLYARTQLVRYARASGLSQHLVIEAVWPILEAEVQSRQPASPTSGSEALVPTPIRIIASSFHRDEVLFEAEAIPEPAPAAGSLPPSSALTPLSPVPPALPYPIEEERGSATYRSSMFGAAAVLALVTAGALWGTRAVAPGRSAVPPRVVRRLPASEHEKMPSQRATGTDASVRRPVAGGSRVIAANARQPETAVARNVEATEDDTLMYSSGLWSAGGAMFSDAVVTGDEDADPGAGLGLRIASVVDAASRNFHTRPSPDGARVAFDSDREGGRAVFLADADGRHVRRISGAGFAAAPNWSRDGRFLSYARAEDHNPDVWNLWMVDVESGESRRLTSNTTGRPLGASWFPDAHRIAYAREGTLVVYDIDTGQSTDHQSPKPGHGVQAPSVSPDGRWVMFQVSGDGAWLLDTTDASTRRVLSDPSVEEYTWSADGTRVAYYSRRDSGWSVFVMASR